MVVVVVVWGCCRREEGCSRYRRRRRRRSRSKMRMCKAKGKREKCRDLMGETDERHRKGS